MLAMVLGRARQGALMPAQTSPLTKLEQQLVDALERLHCGGLCIGSKDFSPEVWKRDLERAANVLVIASRQRAGVAPERR